MNYFLVVLEEARARVRLALKALKRRSTLSETKSLEEEREYYRRLSDSHSFGSERPKSKLRGPNGTIRVRRQANNRPDFGDPHQRERIFDNFIDYLRESERLDEQQAVESVEEIITNTGEREAAETFYNTMEMDQPQRARAVEPRGGLRNRFIIDNTGLLP